MEDLFRILPKIARQFEGSNDVRQAVVFAAWKRAVGESLSIHTVPFSLKEKRLVVSVSDDTWKRHLESLAGQLIFKLNSLLGQAVVTFIEFRVDEAELERHFRNPGREKVSNGELDKTAMAELSPKLTKSAEAIADQELRSQFLRAAGSCLARKRRLSD